jgi:hypothetical protein
MKKAPAFLICLLMLATMVFAANTPVGNYQGMLGTYGTRTTEFPFYLLSIPDGSNVWDAEVEAKLKDKWDTNKKPQQFSARGNFYLTGKTRVKITAGRAVTVKVDGKAYELNNYQKKNGAEIELQGGAHVLSLSVINNGGQLKECGVWITEASNGKVVPIFVTKTEVDEFVSKYAKVAVEVSGWSMSKSKIEAKP